MFSDLWQTSDCKNKMKIRKKLFTSLFLCSIILTEVKIMKREDIQYFNSWAKSFGKCSPAKVMQAMLDGIWIASNKDPEDIYLVYPKLIVRSIGGNADIDKQFGMCPFEFSIEDGETYRWEKEDEKDNKHSCQRRCKSRDIKSFGVSWCLDRYEMRKAVARNGLEAAKNYKITEDEIVALHKKHGWDDDAMYQELIANRPDLWSTVGESRYCKLHELSFKSIRAAFCPHFDTLYNWMDYPEKAGFPEIPNIENRDCDWKAE